MSTVQDLLERAGVWDKQFEQDVAAGRLDKLADEALTDLREGRCPALAGGNKQTYPDS